MGATLEPERERRRLDALRRYAILDTPVEAAFDRIARLAADLFDVPVALLTLVDEERQWFKSRHGLASESLGRDISFCEHTIRGPGPLVVPDARADERFRDSPLVVGEPFFRFYAGAPLMTPDGHAIGTLAVLDHRPRRDFDARRRGRLVELAAVAMDEIAARALAHDLRAEVEARRRSEERFRTVAELLPMALAISRADDGRLLYANQWLVDYWGLDPANPAATSTLEIYLDPEDRRKILQLAEREPVVQGFEFRGVHPATREPIWIRASVRRIDYGGERALLFVADDITRRRDVEEALRAAEERARLAVEAGGLGTYDVDILADRQAWSAALKAMFGLPADADVTSPLFWARIHPDDVPQVQVAVARSRDPGGDGVFAADFRVRWPDGTIRWLSARGRAYFGQGPEGPRAVRCAGVMQDLTERKRLEAALEETRETARLAVEAAGFGTWDWRPETGELILSERIRTIFGLPAGASIDSRGLKALVHPDDRVPLRQALERALDPDGEHRLELEHRIVTADGRLRWLSVHGLTRFERVDGRPRPVRVIGLMRDVTLRREAEQRLRTSLAEKETLLREVHHRVKNNLQAVWGMVQVEAVQLANLPEARARLEAVAERLHVLGGLHQRLYRAPDVSRIELAPHLAELAQGLVELHGRGGDVRLETDLAPLSCDLDTALPLGLVANELVANSLKHAFPGGRRGTIRLSLARLADGRVALTVGDDGIGAAGGTRGTGTVLVAALASQLQAELAVESDGGTRTRLVLPGGAFTPAR